MSDNLDRELEEALASYSARPEPLGLEQRVLRRVQERSHAASRKRFWWAGVSVAAAAVAAGCITWCMVPKPVTIEKPVLTAQVAMPEQPAPVVHVLSVGPTPRVRRSRRIEQPKLAQFPSPSPLASEEKALLRLAAYEKDHPKEKLPSLGEPIQEIQIAAIKIEPIGQEEKP